MKFFHFMLGAAALFAATTACDDNNIGSSILETEMSLVVDSSFTISGESVATNKIQARTVTKLLGNLRAQEYGTLSSDFVTEFMPSTVIDTSNVTVDNIDSLKLVMTVPFESIVGAVYLDTNRNLKKTEKVVKNILDIERFLKENDGEIRISYKNDVQEWCQRYGYDLPTYNTQQFWNGFISYCEIEELGIRERGEGHNRKEAENSAAEYVLKKLEEDFEPEINNFIVSFENAINMLQEYCRQEEYDLPYYETINDDIHDDNRHTFTVRCYLNGRWVDGTGSRVKEAKKQSAYNMLKAMGVID